MVSYIYFEAEGVGAGNVAVVVWLLLLVVVTIICQARSLGTLAYRK